ncbi:hypothetical protein BDN70DRAFT_891873 [Pholiota conissans]|uniref:F-box domain-containing protein n=1 Tax=Pholiota conissans TaxID=109636 RepID=A0A9P5ZB88_9AGAR|nr:hypothetical protein BDN70DRAFT_891873 [Pholiota conissans]
MSSIFPQEILDLFVDEAASDRSYNSHRVDTLKSCSLVCKSISRTARSHIFSDITIDYNFMVDRRGSAKFSKIEDLWHALERDQRLASRVRVFQLNLIKRIEWPKNPRPAHMAIVACWEGIDQVVLPGIMSTLSRTQPKLVPGTYKGRLHTMSLGGYGGAILSWNDLRFDFQREWCMLYALSEITCLRIGSMDDFPVPRALALKPNLRRLEILADDSKSMPRTFLDSFRWKIPIPTNLSSFPALEELECMLILEQWPDRDFCTELIENCASSLRSLKMSVIAIKTLPLPAN